MATTSLSISVKTSDIIAKIRRNLAIIGKRAKNNSGEALFTDLTTSTAEEPIFDDLLMFGAQNIVAELSDVASGYTESTETGIAFTLYSERWNSTDTTKTMDLTQALKGLITNYLYNFCLARYLSAIHPQMGEKYPPLFGQTYTDACAVVIQNIKLLAFVKRPKDAPTDEAGEEITYGDVGIETEEDEETDPKTE